VPKKKQTKKTPRKEHTTVKTTLKRVSIDKEMIPVVEWFNSFLGVETRFCCQGDEVDPGSAYVMYYCSEEVSLIRVLNFTESFGETYIDFYKGHIRYTFRFYSRGDLACFAKLLKDGVVWP
jgi:hypothetical protein